MNVPSPNELSAALFAHSWEPVPALPGRTNHQEAGVLVPLVWRDGTVFAVLTVRATSLREHGGEVSFPGGRPDPSDPDLSHTAFREAGEELGLIGGRKLGNLRSMPLLTSDWRLVPTVAQVPNGPWSPSPDEVASVVELDLCALLSRPTWTGVAWPPSYGFPPSPVFLLDAAGTPPLFGGSAHVLADLLTVFAECMGVSVPPFDTTMWGWDANAGRVARLPSSTETAPS